MPEAQSPFPSSVASPGGGSADPRIPGCPGLGFAVPINLASNVVQQLVTTGQVRHAYVGIAYDDV